MKEKGIKIIAILALLICVQYIFTGIKKDYGKTFANTDENNTNAQTQEDINEGEYLRLGEDIPWRSESRPGWGQLKLNQDGDGNKLSVMREGAYYTFDHGIWAHATSELYFNVAEYSEKYNRLVMYVGLNRTSTAGDGVKFWIYTSSEDTFYTSGPTHWTLQSDENKVYTRGQDAVKIEIDITGAKYLRFTANQISGNASDHSVYIEPMLISEDYKEKESTFPSVDDYDKEIEKCTNKDLSNPEYELLVLQRKLVSNVGSYALERMIEEDSANLETLNWLMNDVENLRYYLMGGEPTGGYYNSIKELTRLYKTYRTDFADTTPINGGKDTKGNLYKRMAITLSLTHSSRIALWMQPSATENQSDSVKRYALYKKLYDEGKFKVTEQGEKGATQTIDITPWFENYNIEEMRWVLGTLIDDEEILWLNEYTQRRIDEAPASAWGLLTPHPYMAYVWPNYANPEYYKEENKEYFNDLFATELDKNGKAVKGKGLFDYEITRGTEEYKLYKLWMNFRNKFGTGAVCGGISKSGHCIRGVNGIASAVIGQPGHAALLYYTRNSEGKGYWGIDNDISGWAGSEKGERLLLGWGNDRTYVRGYNVPYIIMAQEALNDYENFVKAEEILMTVDLQKNTADQEQVYRDAIAAQSINLDAWAGLVKLYVADDTKTEEDCYKLEKEMMEALKCFPFPMHNLSEYLKTKLTSDEYNFKYTILKTKILNEAKNYPAEGETSKVLQPGVTRGLAAYLLGQIDTSLATFSFDGTDAGKIILSEKFDGNGLRWDYSLDGKKNWKEVASTADAADHKHSLTSGEIASITAENDIYVHIVGASYEEENIYKIDIEESEGLPATVFASDLENRVIAVNLSTQWRYSENDAWTSYSVASPDLTGNKTVQLRQGATGTRLASKEPVTFTFTEDNQPDTRKYIPVSHLKVKSVSSQATSQGGAATNAIDANYNTRWHSAWNGSDQQRFIEIELDQSVCLSAVEYVPAGGGNGKILTGTIYGKKEETDEWEELSKLENLTYSNQANDNTQAEALKKNFEIANPKEVKFVKIVADRASNGNWFTARVFNFYQDITQNPHPTAGIAYSTTEKTNGVVVARLVNPSRKITITNNDGKDTYVFTENGDFTFEFVDEAGNKGRATATVTWIDKDGPTADVKYDLDADKKLRILLDNISEDVYILDNNNNKINYVEVDEKTKKIISMSYLDSSGNIYKLVELDADGNTQKITYQNTTNVKNVVTYVTTLNADGTVKSEEFLDAEGNPVEVSDPDKATLRQLQQITRSNPLEYSFDESGDYEFRLLDKASNIAYKSIKVDYIANDTKILVSDITYDITRATNQDVTATLTSYIIDMDGNKSTNIRILSEGGNSHTFDENANFTFEYMDSTEDAESPDREVKTHTAKVSWIDKVTPTARVEYNIKQATNQAVTATLTGASEPITVINNGTNHSYIFYENGKFVFEFEDKAGNRGTATATVNWIDKTIEDPVKYKLGDINGDGDINATDLVLVKRHLVSENRPEWKLSGNNFKAGDINKDGEITATDLVLVKRHLVSENRPEWVIPQE